MQQQNQSVKSRLKQGVNVDYLGKQDIGKLLEYNFLLKVIRSTLLGRIFIRHMVLHILKKGSKTDMMLQSIL